MKAHPLLLVAAGVALLAALPFLLSQGLLNAAIQMLIAALFACAYNLLCGQAGMLSFGHAAYFGVGAFGTVHAMNASAARACCPRRCCRWPARRRPGLRRHRGLVRHAAQRHLLRDDHAGHRRIDAFAGAAPEGPGSAARPACRPCACRRGAWTSARRRRCTTSRWPGCWGRSGCCTSTRARRGPLALGLRENSHRLRLPRLQRARPGRAGVRDLHDVRGHRRRPAGDGNESANYVVFDAGLSATVVLNTYIGGVKVFLGPALGAALMTFFGYAVSDLTQSWLLYQGILFVLVMMFMPSTAHRPVRQPARLRRRFGIARLLPLLLRRRSLAALLLSGRRVFAGRAAAARCSRRTTAPWPACQPGSRGRRHLVRRAWSPGRGADLGRAGGAAGRGRGRAQLGRRWRWRACRRKEGQAAPPPQRAKPRKARHERRSAFFRCGLRKAFGPTEIIRGVDLELRGAERHALIGPNGAGKSTLFHLISGNLKPSAGQILLRRPAHRRPHAAGHQPPRAGALVPDHQHLSEAHGVREHPPGGDAPRGLQYNFWKLIDRDRASASRPSICWSWCGCSGAPAPSPARCRTPNSARSRSR
jgi:branched-chain amino acid transport system permease protein